MLRRLTILIFLVLGSISVPCRAVIVFQKNQDEPIRGFLIVENAVHIEVHEPLPNGGVRKHILPRVSIDDIIRAVDPDRLAALKPEAPEAYRSYAEDLAVKTEDPEARAMAIRLYLIAASLAPDELGRGCLLGMAGLARTPREERAFRAMAFSLDPDHDPALLKPPKMTVSAFAGITEADRKALLTALQRLRTGQLDDARRYFSRPPVQAAATHYSHLISESEYQEAIRAEGRLAPRLLRKFLTLELTLLATTATEAIAEPSDPSPWSQLIARDDTLPASPQTLAELTEFDPRQSVYREGKWRVATE
ncbi:MAG: hypothetical protein O3C40_01150 [Planctomycetota bacterium]|nr:hypothetical protein [Planctomycetota bacterium]